MFARISTGQVQPGKVDEVIAVIRDEIVPTMRQQRGNVGGAVGIDRQTNRVLAGTFWETEADLQATSQASEYLKNAIAKVTPLLVAPLVIENYEVPVRLGVREGNYARVTTVQVRPGKLNEAIALVKEIGEDALRQEPGVRGLHVFVDAASNKLVLASSWISEAERNAFQSGGAAEKYRSRLRDVVAEPIGAPEYFEIVYRV